MQATSSPRRRSWSADVSRQTETAQGAGEPPQQQLPDTCGQCGGRDIRGELVRSAFWEGDRLVVVEDIPAAVCVNCHEQYYDDATVMRIDLLRGDGFPPEAAVRELRVPVFSLRGTGRPGRGS